MRWIREPRFLRFHSVESLISGRNRRPLDWKRNEWAALLEEADYRVEVPPQTINRRDFWGPDMQTAASPPAGPTAQLWIEGHDDEIVGERVVDQDLVGFSRKTGISRSNRSEATTIEQPGDRLDHILVRQKG